MRAMLPCTPPATIAIRRQPPAPHLCSAALLLAASLPPLSSRPLPLRSARLAICGSASGRDSKMMSRTPMGAVTFSRTRSAGQEGGGGEVRLGEELGGAGARL
jgi:hypothetical protein